jgi:hypothetical protein
MSNRNRWIVGFACGTALALSAAPALADDLDAAPASGCTPVGHVASLSGSATAQLPGASARSIACGDTICAGDSVTTGAASSAGLLVGDVLTQLDADSTARIGVTAESAVDVQLARGGARMIDPSSGDAPARLTAVGAQGRITGNDAEGYVLAEKGGQYAMLCEWDEPLEVSRGPQTATAAPGECIVAKPSEPLYEAPGHPERIPALADSCNPGFAIDPVAHLDPLPIVAAGPPGEGPPLPEVPLFPPPSPCDNPGVVCTSGPGLDEQPPTDDDFPGGNDGVFPGGNDGVFAPTP